MVYGCDTYKVSNMDKYIGPHFNIDDFLSKAEKVIMSLVDRNTDYKYSCEFVLFQLLTYLHRTNNFPTQWYNPEDFHKTFRSCDVFYIEHGGLLDSAIYHSIESSKIIWKLFCDECEVIRKQIGE